MKRNARAFSHARAYLLALVPVILLLSAFGPTANAATATGLFSAVTPLTASVPANSQLGYAENNGAAYSADGTMAVVTAPYAPVGGTANAGKAFIYQFVSGHWTLVQEIDDPDAAAGNADHFGNSVAVGAFGVEVLIGSLATVSGQSGAGKAYLYEGAKGHWSLVHEFDDPAPAANDGFGGTGVSVSSQKSNVAISAANKTINGNSGAGEVYVYSDASGTWSQAAAFPDPDGAMNDHFGHALSLDDNGTGLLAGSEAAVNGQSSAGKAYLYTLAYASSTWTQAQEIDDPNATSGDAFGYSGVALSDKGQTAVIGADYATSSATNSGAAYVYSNASGSWTQTAAIADPDATASDFFGHPVAISGNGQGVLIGSSAPASGNMSNAGKAYLYRLTNGSWTKSHEFDDPAATSGDFFGASGVALSSDSEAALITASDATVNGQSSAGKAYSYQSPADISLALSASPSSIPTGNSLALNATVTNTDSTVTASYVFLDFVLPNELRATSSNAAGGYCAASSTFVQCVKSVAPGATWQPSVIAEGMSAGTSYVFASAYSHSEPDPATSNNAATANIDVTGSSSGGSTSGGGGGGGTLGLGALAAFGLLLLAGIKRRS